MPGVTMRLSVTFALACASATFFLFLRCQGTGPPFGRSSRRWALLVIVITGLVSTTVAFAGVALINWLPLAFVGLGIVGPSGLWLSEIRNRGDGRRGLTRDVSTLWLSRLLARMHEGMAEDREAWCAKHIDQEWSPDELSMAARYYQEYVRELLSPDERRRSRINAQVNAIEARMAAVQLIENGAGRPKVVAALQGSRTTKDPRYTRNLDDLSRLADNLRHDAERDLFRLLSYAYGLGLYRMPVSDPRRGNRRALPARRATRSARQPDAT